MTFPRPNCLRALSVSLLCSLPILAQQQPPPQPPPSRQNPNPFEPVPTTPQPGTPQNPPQNPQQPRLENPPAAPAPTNVQPQDTIAAIIFRGARRVPQDTLRALIFTKVGDKYNPEALDRDFMALWNTGRFDDIRLEREPSPTGWVLTFVVTERPVIRSIKYDGMKSISVSEILDRFKE